MTKVSYEYTDSAGNAHEVDSVAEVPPQYRKGMLATGREVQDSRWSLPALSAPALPHNPAALAAGLLAFIFVLNRRNFVVKAMIVAAAVLWLAFNGIDSLLNSKYGRTAAPPPAPTAEESRP
ncbi:MAG TPA: hypothetical protein VNI01_04150 [Elusimicrobiota bacterium]|jgi:hypothetical protein|nr:hypothetical protein [Elusimicrobiota bacterium]